MNLTTLDRVKRFLGISNTASDLVLADLIAGASAFVSNWTGRDLVVTAYPNERRNGTGSSVMLARQYPIISVVSISIDGALVPASAISFDAGAFYLDNMTFTRGVGNVIVNYTAGLSTIPDDLQQIVVDLVARKFKSREWIGYRSKSLAGETITFDASDVPPETKAAMSNYKQVFQAQ